MEQTIPFLNVINLLRGPNGLGFNIRGGLDQPHLPNDTGIFVTKIQENGSAAKDGRLQEGDKITEINGNSLVDVEYTTAVDYFINAGEDVTLRVWHGAEKFLVEEYTEKSKSKGTFTLQKIVSLYVAVLVYFEMMEKPKPRLSSNVINLLRGQNGLGFNVRGGLDQPHLPNDNGCFVTKIRDNGSAAKDGRLQEGDKIIKINGNSLEDVQHATAVDYFINAGEDVTLLVWHGAERFLVEEYTEKSKPKGTSTLQKVLIMGAVVGIVVALYYWKIC